MWNTVASAIILKRRSTIASGVLKIAMSTVFNSSWRTSTKPIFRDNRILTLHQIIIYQSTIFMYRFHHKLLPASMDAYFVRGESLHHYQTRNAIHYRPEYARINAKWFSIKCQGPRPWNALPTEITSASPISRFKVSVKLYIINHSSIACNWKTEWLSICAKLLYPCPSILIYIPLSLSSSSSSWSLYSRSLHSTFYNSCDSCSFGNSL